MYTFNEHQMEISIKYFGSNEFNPERRPISVLYMRRESISRIL